MSHSIGAKASDDIYFTGEALIGNDFSPEQVAEWFADEKEASVDLRGSDYTYGYHALNSLHGWRHLPKQSFGKVLSYGGGTGGELLPIAARLGDVTILEPSSNFTPQIPATYAVPGIDGSFPFPDETFDLVTCLNVLHHIPKVAFAIREMYRTLRSGGFAVLTEPTISMGDWRKKRLGLTPRERGIPLQLFHNFAAQAGFKILHHSRCSFAPLVKFSTLIGKDIYNSRLIASLDAGLSAFPFWSTRYYSAHFLEKIRPVNAFLVLVKPER